MWGHLKDVSSKVNLKSIVNAVAPPLESDDEDYADDNDNYNDNYDNVSQEGDAGESEYYGNGNGKEREQGGLEDDDEDEDEYEETPRGFGLVGMLARALDTSKDDYEDSHSHEEEDEQEEEEEEDQFDQDEIVDLRQSALEDSNSNMNSNMNMNMHAENENENEHASYLEKKETETHRPTSFSPEPPKEKPEEEDADIPAPPARVNSSEMQAPLRRSLVREAGSVTPTNTRRKVSIPNGGLPSFAPPMASVSETESDNITEQIPETGANTSAASPRVSRLQVPRGTKRIEPVESSVESSTNTNTTKGKGPPPVSVPRVPSRSMSDMASLENLPGLPSFIAPGPEHQALSESMEKNSDLDATPSLAEIATTTPATATVSGNVDAGQSGDTDTDTSMSTGVVGTAITATASTESKVEKVKMTNNNPVEAKKPTPPHNERSPPPLESHDAATVHEEDAKEKKTQTLGEGNGQRKEQNTISTSAADSESSKKEPRVTENTIVPEIQKSATITPLHHDDDEASKQLELRCKELERQLGQAEGHIMTLQQQTAKQMEMEEENQQHLLLRFQEKEARLLEAAAEDHQQELALLRGDMDSRFSALKKDTDRERSESLKERDQIERLLDEAIASVEAAEREKKQALSRQGTDSAQYQQRQDRALGMAEDKLAQTMALLDDREDEVEKLNAIVKNLKSNMNEHKEGAHEAEEEIDELHTENDTLRHHVQGLDAQCAELKAKVSELEGASDKISGLKIELRMLKEDNDREKSKNTSVAASAESNTAQLEAERDAAQAGVQDLRQQLSAALADVEVARSDTNRVMMANNNLQSALEAFQSEREAELSMLEEQRMEAEEATAAAHAAALAATHEANGAHLREIQHAGDAAVKNSMNEVKQLEAKLEKYRLENIQMRRSLDEAIHRLQTTQEDVIDRTLMKNILLDWLTKTSSKEKKPVLEIMASVLHFTDQEKERVHMDDSGLALGRAVMGRVAVPLPPSKADMEHLEGDNVREKWVNFLLAETDDD